MAVAATDPSRGSAPRSRSGPGRPTSSAACVLYRKSVTNRTSPRADANARALDPENPVIYRMLGALVSRTPSTHRPQRAGSAHPARRRSATVFVAAPVSHGAVCAAARRARFLRAPARAWHRSSPPAPAAPTRSRQGRSRRVPPAPPARASSDVAPALAHRCSSGAPPRTGPPRAVRASRIARLE